MGFKMGIIVGLVIGYVMGVRASEERREKVISYVDRVTNGRRVQETKSTVSRNVGQVADSVTDRATEAVDKVGQTVDSAVSPSDSSGGSTTPTGSVG